MMKTSKLSLSVLAVATFLACQREKVPSADVYVDAAFAAVLSGEVRSAGDGSHATRLDFYAFEEDGTPVPALSRTGLEDFQVEVSLLRGRTYHFLFLAHSADGIVSVEDRTLVVDYSRVAGTEDADAFYAYQTYTVDSPFVATVSLKRPFAQVNVAASAEDVATAATLGVSLEGMTAILTFSGIGDRFDCVTGTVSGHADAVFSGIPGGTLTVDEVDYHLLATAYVLPSDGAVAGFRAEVGAVRLARRFTDFDLGPNFQTNIVGHILTVGGALCTE